VLAQRQHYNKEFYHLISAIKKTMDRNREVLLFKATGNHSHILQLLLDEGFITSFQCYKGFIAIRLRQGGKVGLDQKRFSLIELAKRIGRRNHTISLTDLRLLQRREGGAAYYVLNTDKGLLTSFNAIEKCVGGELLLKIA
jgi:ribosomal protein S8